MDQGNAEKVSEMTGDVTGNEPTNETPAPEAQAGAAERIQQLEDTLAEREAQLKRMAADFDNARKRMASEREDLVKFAAERIILNLLPVIDNFDRGLQAARATQEAAGVVQGMELIYRQLQEVLTKSGVAAIEAVGQPFDPNLHEAVQRVPADETHADHTIVMELQRGYLLNGKVIRPSLVTVAVAG